MADSLSALRSLMASHSPPLHALIIPSEDYHQSEYVSDRDKRRGFVSGFTGSAGVALVTMEEALLWTDGRYFVQATKELSDDWKLMRMGEVPDVGTWMADNFPKDAAVGTDPWCVSVDTAQKLKKALSKNQQKLVETTTNLIDEVWKNRPPVEINPVNVHPLEFSGRSVEDKLKDLRKELKEENTRAIIFTALDEVAWLYNVRGTDVECCPVVQAFAIVTPLSAFFYVDKRKLSSEVESHMKQNGIEIRDYRAISSDLVLLASDQLSPSSGPKDTETDDGKSCNLIWIDSESCCFALYSKLSSNQVLLKPSPLALAKALKNPVELDGFKNCHIRDGAAVVQYFMWLDKQLSVWLMNCSLEPFFRSVFSFLMQEIYGASGYFAEAESSGKKKQSETTKLTEVSAADKLESFRASKQHFRGLSFPTISSVGPNAAMNHYSPDAKTCSELDPDSIYLCDSGAQYLDGTTDITRTVHFGKPTMHEKTCYTPVLKGHIALDTAHFPNGTIGYVLDILARHPLWKYGLDYRHGTGHGIGSYLNVHEGPHGVGQRPCYRKDPLQASMTLTDEPGYYEDGSFGIRLENLLIVKEADTKFNFGDKGYLTFEHITWAPFQKKLIIPKLLTPEELEWVNTYHSKCRDIMRLKWRG